MNTILITGAGSGIGRATALRLAERSGLRLLLLGRRLDPLKEVWNELANRDDHAFASIDVSHREELVTWLDGPQASLDEHPLVGVFANAGIGGPNSFGEGDRWDEIVRINLTGTYNTLLACYPYLNKSPGIKHALVTSSVLARFGVPGQTAYVASKTGLLGSWQKQHIDVTNANKAFGYSCLTDVPQKGKGGLLWESVRATVFSTFDLEF